MGTPGPIVLALTSNFVAGAALALPVCLQQPLTNYLALKPGQLRLLRAAYAVFLIPMMLAAGLLVDKWSVLAVLRFGLLLLGVMVCLLERFPRFQAALPLQLGLTLATAAVTVASLALLPRVMFPENPLRAVFLGSVFFTGGMAAAPAIASLADRYLATRYLLLGLAAACLIPAIMSLTMSDDNLASFGVHYGFGEIWQKPQALYAAMILFFYLLVEQSVRSWTGSFLTSLGYASPLSIIVMACFWGLFLASRFVGGLLARSGGAEAGFIIALALAAGVTFGNLTGAFRHVSATGGLLLIGLFLGPIAPLAIGAVLQAYPGDSGAALGFVLAVALLSQVLVPPLLKPAHCTGTHWQLRASMIWCLLIMAPAVFLAVSGGNK